MPAPFPPRSQPAATHRLATRMGGQGGVGGTIPGVGPVARPARAAQYLIPPAAVKARWNGLSYVTAPEDGLTIVLGTGLIGRIIGGELHLDLVPDNQFGNYDPPGCPGSANFWGADGRAQLPSGATFTRNGVFGRISGVNYGQALPVGTWDITYEIVGGYASGAPSFGIYSDWVDLDTGCVERAQILSGFRYAPPYTGPVTVNVPTGTSSTNGHPWAPVRMTMIFDNDFTSSNVVFDEGLLPTP